jgi:hypothetical protein
VCRDRADAARVAERYRGVDPTSQVFVVRSYSPMAR